MHLLYKISSPSPLELYGRIGTTKSTVLKNGALDHYFLYFLFYSFFSPLPFPLTFFTLFDTLGHYVSAVFFSLSESQYLEIPRQSAR